MNERCTAGLDRMIREAKDAFPPDFGADDRIIDFIMSHPDLELTADQIAFFLHSSPPFGPDRADYFDVLDRMLSESRRLGDTELVKRIYTTVPFYPGDEALRRKTAFIREGVESFLAQGAAHDAGELCMHLAWSVGDTDGRLEFCERALEYLDRSSLIYAAALALRKMLCRTQGRADKMHAACFIFGDKLFTKDGRVLISPMPYAWYTCDPKEEGSFGIPILKGYNEYLNPHGYKDDSRVIADAALIIGASNGLRNENELVRRADERVLCPADKREYDCRVFSYVCDEMTVENYFAEGVGIVRTVMRGDRVYTFELCDYDIRGGEGLLPLCIGNRWCYRRTGSGDGCTDGPEQTAEREIVSEYGGEYLLSGLDYAHKA